MKTNKKNTKPVESGERGGLSAEVFNHPTMRAYLEEQWPIFGYIGSHNRTVEQDDAVEQALRAAGLDAATIATLLTWKTGRWLADDLSYVAGAPPAVIRARVAKFIAARGIAADVRAARAEAAGAR